jgi:hypothetical protein
MLAANVRSCVKTVLFASLGAAAGYAVTRGGLSFICYFVDPMLWVGLWADWSLMVLTGAYGVAGAVVGANLSSKRR